MESGDKAEGELQPNSSMPRMLQLWQGLGFGHIWFPSGIGQSSQHHNQYFTAIFLTDDNLFTEEYFPLLPTRALVHCINRLERIYWGIILSLLSRSDCHN